VEWAHAVSYFGVPGRMKPTNTRVFRWLAVAYALLVVTVSSWPRLRVPDLGIHGVDKLAHFGQYLILAFLVGRGWGSEARPRRGLAGWVSVAVVVVFAALDEYHQGWIPGRDPDIIDWLADLLGIVIGFWIGSSWFRQRAGLGLPRRETE